MGKILRFHRFDISHNAPSWQRARYNSMILLRSLDSNKQAGPLCKRPGYKEATRALMSLQNALYSSEIQSLQEFLEWLSFHWAEYFAKPENSERQQPSSSSSRWSPSPTWWSSSFWDPKLARQRVVGQKIKNDNDRFTLHIASGNCWRERGVQCCPSQLVL